MTFVYDPFGRRTSIYAYDGNNLVEETNSSGAAVARYAQTQNIDEPLAMLRSGATSYYHADSLGSISSLSNAAGSIVNTYTYDSFGKLTNSSGSLTNPFRYTGREFDSETGLYYYASDTTTHKLGALSRGTHWLRRRTKRLYLCSQHAAGFQGSIRAEWRFSS